MLDEMTRRNASIFVERIKVPSNEKRKKISG